MEVSKTVATADPPDSAPSRRIVLLVIVHLVIAMLPATMGLAAFSKYSLAYLWAVSSISFAEVMLLAMLISMVPRKPFLKILAALLGVAYISFWQALGAKLLGGQNQLVDNFVRDCMMVFALLAVLTIVMLGVRRWLGHIQHFHDPELLDASAQTRYSLFTALGLTTAGSFFMALFRMSVERRESGSSFEVIAHILLIMTTLSLLMVSLIWATLAPGIVRYRMTANAALTVLFGVSLAVSAGHTPEQGGWWMLAAATSIVIVPAAIVCGSLLFLRTGGYRLVKAPLAAAPRKIAD
jgi:hypothetical protein